MNGRIVLFSILLSAVAAWGGENACPPQRYDFGNAEKFNSAWSPRGFCDNVPKTTFQVVQDHPEAKFGGVLTVAADRATGVVGVRCPNVDLRKTPIMRWRWRVVSNVACSADGRFPEQELDDQPIAIYVGEGNVFSQRCVGYRWERNAAVGSESLVKYAAGTMRVWRICMRNRNTEPGVWVVEERNVAEDFRRAFGNTLGRNFVLSIGANSQYSPAMSRAEIDYIEFRPLPEKPEAAPESAAAQ